MFLQVCKAIFTLFTKCFQVATSKEKSMEIHINMRFGLLRSQILCSHVGRQLFIELFLTLRAKDEHNKVEPG